MGSWDWFKELLARKGVKMDGRFWQHWRRMKDYYADSGDVFFNGTAYSAFLMFLHCEYDIPFEWFKE